MNRPRPKGWCPGVLQPMMSGDGLLVRIRPRLGRLTAEQVQALCLGAQTFGRGLMDLTSRANIQIRGVTPETYAGLLECLRGADLVDADEHIEARNNILVSPLWSEGDDTWAIASELTRRLSELPELPSKFGFAIDAGAKRFLGQVSADVRVERSVYGGLIVRADGTAAGVACTRTGAADAVIALSQWFVETGGATSKRMRHHVEIVASPAESDQVMPQGLSDPLMPGTCEHGPVYGTEFGRVDASELLALFQKSGAHALRMTPWRSFILEGGQPVVHGAFLSTPTTDLRTIDACPGAPYCEAATVETHGLARLLVGENVGPVHVSGCSKGCARPTAAKMTVVGREGKYDLVRGGCAWDKPDVVGLNVAEVVTHLEAS